MCYFILRKFVGQSLKNPEINNYNILAPKGKSLSFTANLTGESDK